jgi:hypothetical protein
MPFVKTCTLGSCDDHIFSQLCTNIIVNLQCPRYETIPDRTKNTIEKMRHKLDKREKAIIKEWFKDNKKGNDLASKNLT